MSTRQKLTAAQRWPHLFGYSGVERITGNLWGMNPGGGRFYMAGRIWIPTTTKLDLLKAAGVTHVEAHDTDVLDLVLGEKGALGYPKGMSEAEKMRLAREAARKLKEECEKRGLKVGMWTMNLFNSDVLFIFGNLGSENDKTRELAIQRTIVGMEIAQELGCIYVFWNGTNGPDGPFAANYIVRYERTYQAIVQILRTMHRRYGDKTQPMAAENKGEEPKLRMLNPVSQSFTSLALRLALEHPVLAGLLGDNIEFGHEEMMQLDPAMSFAEALFHGVLLHTHFNDQNGKPGFDADLGAGITSFTKLVDSLLQLRHGKYTGLIGIDAQPTPTDSDDQQSETIALSVLYLRAGLTKADELDTDELRALRARHDQAGINRYIARNLVGIAA